MYGRVHRDYLPIALLFIWTTRCFKQEAHQKGMLPRQRYSIKYCHFPFLYSRGFLRPEESLTSLYVKPRSYQTTTYRLRLLVKYLWITIAYIPECYNHRLSHSNIENNDNDGKYIS